MKKFAVTLLVFIVVLLFWSAIGMKKVTKNDYISHAVLDMSEPLGVTIDVEFIKGLNPANGE